MGHLFSGMSIWLVTLAAFSCAAMGEEAEPTLFTIKRSLNANELDYRARNTDCKWDASKPIHPKWRMLNEPPGPDARPLEEELKWYERPGYGVALRSTGDSEVRFSVKPVPEVEVTARLEGYGGSCRARATTIIEGKSVAFKAVYIMSTGAWPTLTVHYFTLYGCDGTSLRSQRTVRSALSAAEQSTAEELEKTRVAPAQLCLTNSH